MESYRSPATETRFPRTAGPHAGKTLSVRSDGGSPGGRKLRRVTVEPLVFLFMFGLFLMIFTQQQYFFWRYGRAALARGDVIARNCVSAEDLERGGQSTVDVQKSASHLLSYVNAPGQLLGIATSMVLGPLSDTLGRNFIFYSAGIGVVLQGLLSLAIVWFGLDMHLFIIGGLLSGLFGGFASTLGACFAYAADVSSPGPSRSIRISLIEAMVFVAGLISEGGAGKLVEVLDCSFWPLLVIYTASGLLMILYTALFLPEPFSRSERLARASDHPKGAGRVLRGLRLFFCPSSYSTWRLWAALGVLIVIVGNLVGAQMITAIFQEGPPLKWKPAMIGYFDMTQMASHGFATLVVLPLLVTLSLPDVATALIGVVFSGGTSLFTGFVQHSWQMFLIGTVSGMEAIVAPSARSLMSKLVSAGDQGALFSFALSVELLAAAMATAFYPNIFPVILSHSSQPGYVYFIMAAISIIPLILLGERSQLEGKLPTAPSSGETDAEEEETEEEEEEPLLYTKDLLQYPTRPRFKGQQYIVN